ncbi:MAG TPA: DUF4340 domain-containing protein [Thermoanaerobaculia bacterium]|nr:DUF4340 domain-containing protein [Thermoanaerobaculia bacterium]
MRPRTLLALLALVAGLAAFVLLFERDLPSSDERAERAKRLFPGFEAEAVTAVEIEAAGGRLRIERSGAPAAAESGGEAASDPEPPAEWRLVAPLAARADAAAVEGLLSALAALPRVRGLDGVERAAVGLEPPRFRLRLATEAGERTLEVGAAVPASHDVVVAEAGRGELLVTSAGFLADLERPAGEWRARELFPGRREAIERLVLDGPEGRVVLARDGESWRLAEPVADRADRDLVAGLLTDLAALRAEAFLDAGPEAAGGFAAGTIEAHLAGVTEPFRVELGEAGASPGRLRARVAGQEVEIAPRLAEAVARAAGAWRSRAWSALDSWQVDAVAFEDGAGRTALERREGEWLRDGARIAYGPAGDLLYLLAGLRAERLAETSESAALTAGAPRLTLELTGPEGSRERLLLHPEREGLFPAVVEGREAVLLLAASAVADLDEKLAAVRTAPLAEEPPAVPAAAPEPAPVAPAP